MNKAQLVELVQKQLGKEASKAAAERAVDAVTQAIAKGLKDAGEVQLVGFGTFRRRERQARQGRNPATGVAIEIPASKTVRFSAGKLLKQQV
jgi:nucleoid DNA-binding protein